jgi:type VI secretion system protein ImpH
MPRNNLSDLLPHLPFDISVEALAGCLLESEPEVTGSGQLLVRPLGHQGRAVAREVQDLTGAAFDAEGKELFYLDINREGLFDSLPEMLFLRRPAEEESPLEKAQNLASQKEATRRFFLPFEEVLYRARIDAEGAEREAIKGMAGQFLCFFGLGNQTEKESGLPEQLLAFALALPLTDRIVGDLDLVKNLLETVLGKNVTLTPAASPAYPIPEAQQSRLGEALLGIDLLSGSTFSDGIRTLEATVYDVTPEEVEDWLPGGKLRQLLEGHLLPRLLTVGENVTVQIEITGSAGDLILGEEYPCSTLGYTTILS